ncbi:hypothetical protein MCOR25_000728 [Pyricularia grisea]|uniref:Small ribosomal subunit protein uS4m n=1 Tax=Pyricularia grisea TaxID=148305 RepID=A0A6P8BCR8_PYRGI|nr:uncharacterized protein PgNI_03981 [Pyricularia grisea]KAI6382435.1 hypothetical protein MCOR25_000728 [Pyricularia grisea]TLD13666.1 hypothetical protein PgNI_03981 [Pyricularia grisea]
MKLRRSLRMHNLKRQRVRMSWNKYNLYNLSKLRIEESRLGDRTFFQQKWAAKAMTRAYHGEHIKEGQWERMFSRKIESVVNMNPRYMAENDGSEQATGRGSGKKYDPDWRAKQEASGQIGPNPYVTNVKTNRPTPYMQMTYAPMERRLDIAIFRALFASSARQARQFCVHGFVKVNGQPMRYPGYLLNPGDMFQVDPDRVMMATGAKKGNVEFYLERQKNGTKRAGSAKAGKGEEEAEVAEEDAEAAAEETSDAAVAVESAETEPVDEAEALKKTQEDLKKLLASAKDILKTNSGKDVEAKRKQKLRAFTKEAKEVLARTGRKNASVEGSTIQVDELSNLLSSLAVSPAEAKEAAAKATSPSDPNSYDGLTDSEKRRFHEIMDEYNENPVDFSKPYWTPWKPRKWLAPFVFIPQYLEVNQNVCSAVYLRHPVARAGQSEVPSPFPEFIGQLAFNWYLRRR